MLAACLLNSCAASLERAHVARRFSTLFGCPHPSVHQSARGYVAEGCGTVAHFTCFDGDDDDDLLFTPGSWGAILSAVVDSSGGRDTCILEHSAHTARVALPVPVQRKVSEAGVIVKTRLLFAGGHLVALGKPAERPAHALISVHTLRHLDPAPCPVALFDDGVSIPIYETERVSDRDARVVVPVDSLANIDKSVRFAGSVCGAEFELDAAGREALGRFHARFAEERERGKQKLATSSTRE